MTPKSAKKPRPHPWADYSVGFNTALAAIILREKLQEVSLFWMAVRMLDRERMGGESTGRIKKYRKARQTLAERLDVEVQTIKRWERKARKAGWVEWDQKRDLMRYKGYDYLTVKHIEKYQADWQDLCRGRAAKMAAESRKDQGPIPWDTLWAWLEMPDGPEADQLVADHFDIEASQYIIASDHLQRLNQDQYNTVHRRAKATAEHAAADAMVRAIEAAKANPDSFWLSPGERREWMQWALPKSIFLRTYHIPCKYGDVFTRHLRQYNAALHDMVQTWATMNNMSRDTVAAIIKFTSRSAKRWNADLNTRSTPKYLLFDPGEVTEQLGGKARSEREREDLIADLETLEKEFLVGEDFSPKARSQRVSKVVAEDGKVAVAVQINSQYETRHIRNATPAKRLRHRIAEIGTDSGAPPRARDSASPGDVPVKERLNEAKFGKGVVAQGTRRAAARYLLALLIGASGYYATKWAPMADSLLNPSAVWVEAFDVHKGIPSKPSQRLLKEQPKAGRKLVKRSFLA